MKILFSLLLVLLVSCSNAETRIKIAVIDTGINQTSELKQFMCKTGHKSFVDTPWDIDEFGHGTLVSELITKDLDPKKYCLISIKWFNRFEMRSNTLDNKLFGYVFYLNPKYVNMSFTMREDGRYWHWFKLMTLTRTHLFIAAGNDLIDLDYEKSYPPSYELPQDYFHVVGDHLGNYYGPYSNYGSKIQYWISGRYKGMAGTSFSAPRALNMFIKGTLE